MLKRVLTVVVFTFAVLLLSPARAFDALAAEADTYSIDVDIANQITTVYRSSDHAVVRQMICSTGEGDKTPRGTFNLEKSRPTGDRGEWYYIGNYNCYVRYPTRIVGSILFHSIPYASMDLESIDREALAQLGSKASHGCIRLRWEDAMWIAMNCPDGTAVKIFTSPIRKTALREKLLSQSYADMTGTSYAQFTNGIPESDGCCVMGRGESGDAVYALQRGLARLGFLAGEISGIYDEATIAAVTRYQVAAGMNPSGVADETLMKKIMAEDRITGNYMVLSEGCSGPAVSRLQASLKDLGLFDGEIDGRYGPSLASSVAACQRLFSLESTGKTSPELQSMIEDICTATFCQGDRSPAVTLMERALYALQYYDGDCNEIYSLNTAKAVRFFTRANSMPESAVATPEIQRAIFNQYISCELAYGAEGYALSLTDCETRVAIARGEIQLFDRKSGGGRALATLKKGAQAVVLEEGRAWCLLSCNGATGYARTRLLELSTRIDQIAEFNAPKGGKADPLVYGSETEHSETTRAEVADIHSSEINGLTIEAYEAVPDELEFALLIEAPYDAEGIAMS